MRFIIIYRQEFNKVVHEIYIIYKELTTVKCVLYIQSNAVIQINILMLKYAGINLYFEKGPYYLKMYL